MRPANGRSLTAGGSHNGNAIAATILANDAERYARLTRAGGAINGVHHFDVDTGGWVP